jgi:hypothetical protein
MMVIETVQWCKASQDLGAANATQKLGNPGREAGSEQLVEPSSKGMANRIVITVIIKIRLCPSEKLL